MAITSGTPVIAVVGDAAISSEAQVRNAADALALAVADAGDEGDAAAGLQVGQQGGSQPRQIPALLLQLRISLPDGIELWAGGSGVARIDDTDGVLTMPTLDDALHALAAWQAAHA